MWVTRVYCIWVGFWIIAFSLLHYYFWFIDHRHVSFSISICNSFENDRSCININCMILAELNRKTIFGEYLSQYS